MSDGLVTLVSLCSLIFFVSFLAGSLSLYLSQRKLRYVSTIAAGVLVGTALTVIIPEGVETLYGASRTRMVESGKAKGALLRGGMALNAIHPPPISQKEHGNQGQTLEGLAGIELPAGFQNRGVASNEFISITTSKRANTENENEDSHHAHDDHDSSPHAVVGVALLFGFLFMYLVDTLPSLAPSAPAPPQTIGLGDLSQNPAAFASISSSPARSHSTTTGLIVHALADGLALGASSQSPTLSLVVFSAIMLHKAPTAFGLTAVLLKQGLGKRMARAHLILFSLAAPAGAIGTWFLVNLLGQDGSDGSTANSEWWTGVVLIFSGGTFL